MLKQNCNCSLLTHSHFRNQCLKVEKAKRDAEWAAKQKDGQTKQKDGQTTPLPPPPVGSVEWKKDAERRKVRRELTDKLGSSPTDAQVLAEVDRRERGAVALAKSTPAKKERSTDDACSTRASESDVVSKQKTIMSMFLRDSEEKDLKKKLRLLQEVRLAEEKIAAADLSGQKVHPNLRLKAARKTELTADPLIQKFRRAGGDA